MSLTHAAAHAASGAIKPASEPMDQLCVNTIRTLAMDAVQAANSGHPGTPMALAPVVYCPVATRPAHRPQPSDLAQP